MKKLVLGALLAVVSSTGCIITSDSGDSVVSVQWSFGHLASSVAGSCAHSDDTAMVISQRWDPDAQLAIGSPVVDQFNCTDGRGDVTLPDDVYLMWVEIHSVSGQVIGKSDQFVVYTELGDRSINPYIYDDGGYFSFSWDLVDKATSARVSCSSAGITSNGSVEIISTNMSNSQYFKDDKFTCQDHAGTTDPLMAGLYTISVNAEENNAIVGDPSNFSNKQIVSGNVTDLGNIKIKVPAR